MMSSPRFDRINMPTCGTMQGATQYVLGGSASYERLADGQLTTSLPGNCSMRLIDALLAATSIGVCVDVAHIAAGGGYPVSFIKKYADRLEYIHLKDLDPERNTFLPLGRGSLDMVAVVEAVIAAGYNNWITVELDGYDGDQESAALQSLQFLREKKLVI
ncbi:hypothetical protein FQR65_LT20620 [Abscondita terminalis]|nr:hypothetical protein FQR65_LT20620 [Abscondita terminalis]